MRCLYCGKQLALLRRLTGGGEFCSDAHKQSYQEEYNRLALSRLLQAQSKPGEIKTRANVTAPAEGLGQPLPPGASRHRALESSTPQPEPEPEVFQPSWSRRTEPGESVESKQEEPAPIVETPVEVPEPEEAYQSDAEPEPVVAGMETSAASDDTSFAGGDTGEVEESIPELAAFSMELPVVAWLPDISPATEPYIDPAPLPEIAAWSVPSQPVVLPLAAVTSLQVGEPTSQHEAKAQTAEISPQEFAAGKPDLAALSQQWAAHLRTDHVAKPVEIDHPLAALATADLMPLKISPPLNGVFPLSIGTSGGHVDFPQGTLERNVPLTLQAVASRIFPSASPIAFDFRIATSRANQIANSNGALNFAFQVAFENSPLLGLSPAAVDYAPEEADVVLAAPWADSMFASESEQAEAVETETSVAVMDEEVASPRQALEALARLHDELATAQEIQEAPADLVAAELEVVQALAALPEPAQPVTEVGAAPTIEVSPERVDEPVNLPPVQDLFEIPMKTFGPSKPLLAIETGALVNISPEIPPLRSLPLRPKVAKVPPGLSPHTGAPAPTSVTEQAAKIATIAQQRPRPEVKTKTIPAQISRAAPSPSKPSPGQPVKPPQTAKTEAAPKQVSEAKPEYTVKPPQPAAKAPATPSPKPAPGTKEEQTKPEPSKAEPVASKTAAAGEQTPAPLADDAMPSFATVKPKQQVPFLASMKLKLIIALVFVAGFGGAFMFWNKKGHPSPAGNTVAEDVLGPSIMMGEGGWQQDWSGDTNGAHNGRQITIYQPSLKLSDYRMEFQGEIDSKSIGWVFRALDPYNYYAAKLAVASGGSSPRYTLIKYSVEQGKETEVGRVPLNITAGTDSVFTIRTDVRGETFRISVNGQPVDTWTDARLKSGGAGFLNERAERARIKSVSIFYLTGGKN